MSPFQVIWTATLVLTLHAGWNDWRSRKIPNWLTVTGFFLGIAVNSFLFGWRGTKASLEGAGLALVIFLPLVLLRALGAGDWKLMGAVGALLGPVLLLLVMIASVFVAGIMAVVEVIRSRRVKQTARNLAVLVAGFCAFGIRTRPDISIDNPGLLKIPFGVAVAAATAICYCALWRRL